MKKFWEKEIPADSVLPIPRRIYKKEIKVGDIWKVRAKSIKKDNQIFIFEKYYIIIQKPLGELKPGNNVIGINLITGETIGIYIGRKRANSYWEKVLSGEQNESRTKKKT